MFYLKAMTKAMLNMYFITTNKVLSVDQMIMMALQSAWTDGRNPTDEEMQAMKQGHNEFVAEMKQLGKI